MSGVPSIRLICIFLYVLSIIDDYGVIANKFVKKYEGMPHGSDIAAY